MDLTEGLAKELRQKAEENRDDPRVLLEILRDLTTWSDDEIAEMQRDIIDRVAERLSKPFDWPGPDAPSVSESEEELDTDEWPNVGLLKQLGYTTGKSGKTEYERRAILHRALQVDAGEWLPSEEQAKEWGEPESEKRLEKIANSLSSFAGMEKKKEHPAGKAISHWENDLEYLKERFYDPGQSFDWPNTDITDAGVGGSEKHPKLPFGED